MGDVDERTMKILKAMISDGSGIGPCDAIEYQGRLWIVPKWLETPVLGYKIPARLIRFDTLQHQRGNFLGCQFSVSAPIPKAVLDGQIKAGYEVIDGPDIRFPIPKGVH